MWYLERYVLPDLTVESQPDEHAAPDVREGEALTVQYEFIPPGQGPPRISDDAKWVVVDRSYSSIWEHPEFQDLSQARQFLVRGRLKPEELRVLKALRADPRFELVFYNPVTNQAVFRRIQ